jgi:2-keto-3-deoxy-6-phosphogluconate aldolase
MAYQITVEALYPFLEARGITEDQLEGVEMGLDASLTFSEGNAGLIHRDTVLKALEAIDDYPWKDTSPREFREWLQGEVTANGARYWLVGADTLPLEEM